MCVKDWKTVAVAAVVFAIVAQIVHTTGAVVTMGYYTNPAYFALWSNLMMPNQGPPGTDFLIASIIVNLAVGAILAGAYLVLKPGIPGKGLRKGINYGILLFLVAGVPGYLSTYLLLAVPAMLLLDWAVESLIIYLVLGATLAKLAPK